MLEEISSAYDRHGYPPVELNVRSSYGLPMDGEKWMFLNVIYQGNAESIAEQIWVYEGRLTEEQVLAFFSGQLGHSVARRDLAYKTHVSFSGIRLYVPELTPVYFDEKRRLLCMWEDGTRNVAGGFRKTGISYRVLLDPMTEDRA